MLFFIFFPSCLLDAGVAGAAAAGVGEGFRLLLQLYLEGGTVSRACALLRWGWVSPPQSKRALVGQNEQQPRGHDVSATYGKSQPAFLVFFPFREEGVDERFDAWRTVPALAATWVDLSQSVCLPRTCWGRYTSSRHGISNLCAWSPAAERKTLRARAAQGRFRPGTYERTGFAVQLPCLDSGLEPI